MPLSPKQNYTWVQRCLKSRQVLVMGNSIHRGLYYQMREFLGEEAVGGTHREEQKRECGRGGHVFNGAPPITAHQSHHTRCGAPPCGYQVQIGIDNCTNLRFLWQQDVFDQQMIQDVQYTKPDLLIINAGGGSVFDEHSNWNETTHTQSLQLRAFFSSMLQFAKHMQVYWLLVTPLCGTGFGKSESMNPNLKYVNEVINASLQKLDNVKVLDFWDMNINRCHDYDDVIHHSRLGRIHTLDILENFCNQQPA